MKRNLLRWAIGIATASLLLGGISAAAEPPPTAEVLAKLRASNQKEIDAGKLAQKHGQSRQVKDFGKMLVRDHTAADKKVAALAKQEDVALAAAETGSIGDMAARMTADPDFDQQFARDMLEDHKKDIAEVTEARDATQDPKLKKLLSELLPTLQKHEETAQKILDTEGKR